MIRKLNPELLKMAQVKVAAIPADPMAGGGGMPPAGGDPMAGGAAPPPGAMPPGAAPAPPPTMGMPMDPMAGGMPPAPPAAAPAAGKPKLDPIHIEKRLHDMHKMVAQMAGSMGLQIQPEDTVEPPAGDMQAQMEQSMAQGEAAGAMPPQPGMDPAAGGAPPQPGMDPAAGGMAPPGGGLGDIGGMSGMKAAHMVNTLHNLIEKVAHHVMQGEAHVPMGRPIPQPKAAAVQPVSAPDAPPATPGQVMNKAAATNRILRERAKQAQHAS